jgi:5-oxoprolinase (ATP-hydrolysing)
MPPTSTSLKQEGAVFRSFKIVLNGEFQEKGDFQILIIKLDIYFIFILNQALIDALNEPAKYPNCSASRNLNDNISDLKAQIAANKKVLSFEFIFKLFLREICPYKGIELINQLINEYTLQVVQSYMIFIQVKVDVKNKENLVTNFFSNRILPKRVFEI